MAKNIVKILKTARNIVTESSTDSSEDLVSDFETELSSADVPNKIQKDTARWQKISLRGDNNRVLNNCRVILAHGEDQENQSRHTLSKSGRKRSRTPSPQTRLKRRREVSALEEGSIVDLCNSLDFRSENAHKEIFELTALLRVCKTRLIKAEDDSNILQKENEVLKLQNKELINTQTSSKILKKSLIMAKKENLSLQKDNETLNGHINLVSSIIRLSVVVNERIALTEEKTMENELLKRLNSRLMHALLDVSKIPKTTVEKVNCEMNKRSIVNIAKTLPAIIGSKK